MTKHLIDFNTDPSFLSGSEDASKVREQIANNNAFLQQQKRGGTTSNTQGSKASPLGSIATIDSNNQLTIQDPEKWQKNMSKYVSLKQTG